MQQAANLREQLNIEANKLKETQENTQCRIRAEECQRSATEEKMEKVFCEMQQMKEEHLTLSEYLIRLSRSLCWSDCIDQPTHGHDTAVLAERLLERAEHLAIHTDHGNCEKNCFDLPAPSHHHHHLPKLRRERSCHDIPLKEVCYSTNIQFKINKYKFYRIELNSLLSAEENSRDEGTSSTARSSLGAFEA